MEILQQTATRHHLIKDYSSSVCRTGAKIHLNLYVIIFKNHQDDTIPIMQADTSFTQEMKIQHLIKLSTSICCKCINFFYSEGLEMTVHNNFHVSVIFSTQLMTRITHYCIFLSRASEDLLIMK